MTEKIKRVKIKLIELGYIDNEWLDKYLTLIETNLDTKQNQQSTQAHHAIPVNSYWQSDKPYDRQAALKLARVDSDNFSVNLLYSDHLLAHAYLTLCTNLAETQRHYEAQEALRKHNSQAGWIFIHKCNEFKRIPPAQLLTYLNTGWKLGKKETKKCHIHKDGNYKIISIAKLPDYLQAGWTYGAAGKPRRIKSKK